MLQIWESLFSNAYALLAAVGVFFGLVDLLKHLGNRMDKRRGMEIFRELMKERFALMNTAVQFGADTDTLAELNKLLEKHGDLSELQRFVELRVGEDTEAKATVQIHNYEKDLPAADLQAATMRRTQQAEKDSAN
jgi:hypothetical protein